MDNVLNPAAPAAPSAAAADATTSTASASSSSPSRSSSSSTAYPARVSRTCVYPPTVIRIRDPDSPTGTTQSSLLQFSLHTAPITLKRELQTILPSLNPADPLLILPTFQPSTTPLTTVTLETEAEKNRLLITFAGIARALCHHLLARGYFADYIDPCTGHPALSPAGSAVYSEVDGASALLRYRVEQAGCCGVVLHPVWGSGCYPASCVTNARVEAVLEGLERVRRRWEVRDEQQQQQREEKTTDGGRQQHGHAGSGGASDSAESEDARPDEQRHPQGEDAMRTQNGNKLDEEKIMSGQGGAAQQRIVLVSTSYTTTTSRHNRSTTS